MTRNRLLLVQTGTPPTAIRQAHGDLPRWFRTLLAPWQTQLTTVRVFEDEPLPTPDNQTIAVLTGSWAMVTPTIPTRLCAMGRTRSLRNFTRNLPRR